MRSSGLSGKQPYPLSYSPITTRDDPRLPEIAARSRAALLALRARAGPAAVDQQRVGFWVVADDASNYAHGDVIDLARAEAYLRRVVV